MQIILQPVLFQPGRGFISTLEKVLSEEFNSSISTTSPITEIPLQLFDKQRNQCKSNEVLQWVSDKHRPNRTTKILALCVITIPKLEEP
ncbi:MAG TPA: hypothetical protein VFJ05_06155 [Nitrososphaeraceae archaeon]|nr:hypothetical protein [Nitrososphaeraceae archaeon]